MTWKKTACILCECNCGLDVQLGGPDGRQLLKFRGDRDHPSSRGYACEKPHRLNFYQNSRQRLTSPQRRRADGSFEPIAWDTAIREVAERLLDVRDRFGGDKIFYYGGGGQGNHLPGAYSAATRRALGSRFRSSALAQEKTGEFWVADRMIGSATRGDFDHCEVGIFIGKNPWQSHSIPRARVVLKALASDPNRTLIVIDPRVSETAAMADVHLAVRPGADAWLLAALALVLIEEDLVDHSFIEAHTRGFHEVKDVLQTLSVTDLCARAGVQQAQVRQVARIIGRAESVASFEDLGVQMNRHSTVVSYLHRFLWLFTGNLGKPGSQYIPSTLVNIASGNESSRPSPVTGSRIVGGMVPCNVIADEILTDHPDRFRAMLVEAANPAHSLADSVKMREALEALDLVVVIDVAMTETAQHADYVLPASTQFEKAEATFFNFDFPENYFHLRRALLTPPSGVLSEAEIHARLLESMGFIDPSKIEAFREAAKQGLPTFAQAFAMDVMSDRKAAAVAPVVLYRALQDVLPEGLKEGAAIFGAIARRAMSDAGPLEKAGFGGSPLEATCALFQRLLDTPSGVVFAIDDWADVRKRIDKPNGRVELALPDLLEVVRGLGDEAGIEPESAYPFVLSAGERRSFTANTIFREPDWRKKDAAGALRMGIGDADRLGVVTGDRVRLTTKRGTVDVVVEVSDTMQLGHISLPNGMGIGRRPDGHGGIAPNELTSTEDRDPFVGTPWHKSVPARVDKLDGSAA